VNAGPSWPRTGRAPETASTTTVSRLGFVDLDIQDQQPLRRYRGNQSADRYRDYKPSHDRLSYSSDGFVIAPSDGNASFTAFSSGS
jgi:hypothetical protein